MRVRSDEDSISALMRSTHWNANGVAFWRFGQVDHVCHLPHPPVSSRHLSQDLGLACQYVSLQSHFGSHSPFLIA